jgi:hypothetical protein
MRRIRPAACRVAQFDFDSDAKSICTPPVKPLSQESNIKLIDIAAKLVQGERPAE